MKPALRTLQFLLLILIIAAALAAVFSIINPGLFKSFIVFTSAEFAEPAENIFISKDTPADLKDSLLLTIREADRRVCTFLNTNKRKGTPVIIFCYSDSLLKKYSSNNLVLTYKTPFNCFIICGRERVDTDVISHELFHTEFCERTGYFNNAEIPVWFDEGLAMQVDYREEYSEEKYIELRDSLSGIKLPDISTPESFYSGNFYHHFLRAKHEVATWLNSNEGNVFDLIKKIAGGENFYEAYNTL